MNISPVSFGGRIKFFPLSSPNNTQSGNTQFSTEPVHLNTEIFTQTLSAAGQNRQLLEEQQANLAHKKTVEKVLTYTAGGIALLGVASALFLPEMLVWTAPLATGTTAFAGIWGYLTHQNNKQLATDIEATQTNLEQLRASQAGAQRAQNGSVIPNPNE